MYRLTIIDIDEYTYTLKDSEENIYKKVFHFINTKYKPTIGDYITLPETILNEKNIYTFGSVYKIENDDVIKIERNNDTLYLQRYYG